MWKLVSCVVVSAGMLIPAPGQAGFFQAVPPPAAAVELRALWMIAQGEIPGSVLEEAGLRVGPSLTVLQKDQLKASLQMAAWKDISDATKKAGKERERGWRPVVTIPALKITSSSRPDSLGSAIVDVKLLPAVGGGISYQYLKWDPEKDGGKEKGGYASTFSFSPLTILLSGDLEEAGSQLNASWAATLGFWDNTIMIGGGFDFGEVGDRSRWFGLLSIGMNFNNK